MAESGPRRLAAGHARIGSNSSDIADQVPLHQGFLVTPGASIIDILVSLKDCL
jgi:hypothetical protein